MNAIQMTYLFMFCFFVHNVTSGGGAEDLYK